MPLEVRGHEVGVADPDAEAERTYVSQRTDPAAKLCQDDVGTRVVAGVKPVECCSS